MREENDPLIELMDASSKLPPELTDMLSRGFVEAKRMKEFKLAGGCRFGRHFYPKVPDFKQKCQVCKEWF